MKIPELLMVGFVVDMVALVVVVLGQVEAVEQSPGYIGFQIEKIWRNRDQTREMDIEIRVDFYLGVNRLHRANVYKTTGDHETWRSVFELKGEDDQQPRFLWLMDEYKDVGQIRWVMIPHWLMEAIKTSDPPIAAVLVSGKSAGNLGWAAVTYDYEYMYDYDVFTREAIEPSIETCDDDSSELSEPPTTSHPLQDLLKIYPEPVNRLFPPFRIRNGAEYTKPVTWCVTGFMRTQYYAAMKFKLHVIF